MHKQYDRARSAVAAGPASPLKGAPCLIKDLGVFETGEPAMLGSSLLSDFVADHDSAYVRGYKQADLVIMGAARTASLASL